jgi:iron complex transport system substrate-binding protein
VRVHRAASRTLRLVAGVLLVAACAPARPDRGPGPARRVVSLSPAFTELLFAIGAGPAVVGRTAWGDTPPAALAVPSVGDGMAPNVEAILARDPDLVVVYASGANAAAVERLRQAGVTTLTLVMDRLDDVPPAARRLGEATGHAARADSLAAAFAAALDSARRALRPTESPHVLLLAWDQPPIVIGAGSFQHELVTLAGATNVFADVAAPSSQVTIETIAARDPDEIVRFDAVGEPGWATRAEWQVVRAVRQHRFVTVHGSEFARPSLRALAGVRALQSALEEAAR